MMKTLLVILLMFLSVSVFSLEPYYSKDGEIQNYLTIKGGLGPETGGLYGVGFEYKYRFVGLTAGIGYVNEVITYSGGLRGYWNFTSHAAFFCSIGYGTDVNSPFVLGGIVTVFSGVYAEAGLGISFIDNEMLDVYQLSLGLAF